MHKMYDVVPNVDVSNLDGYVILFMIFSTIRGERFCDGLVSGILKMAQWINGLVG